MIVAWVMVLGRGNIIKFIERLVFTIVLQGASYEIKQSTDKVFILVVVDYMTRWIKIVSTRRITT